MAERMENVSIKVRLRPTKEQAERIDKTFGCCRWLWNRMLADEQEFYAATDQHFLPTPARYKKEAPFLKEADSQALATVHQNLRQAFQAFFKNNGAGYPAFKRKKAGRDAYTIYRQTYSSGKGANLYLTERGIRMPKIGLVEARFHRRPLHWWTLKSATVSKSPAGNYDCSLTFAYPAKEPEAVLPTEENVLGLQYSISRFYVDSRGYSPDPPHWLAESQQKLRRMQKKLARMERGSGRYQKQLQKIQRLHEHIANQRRDFAHKESRRIANAWGAVCLQEIDLRQAARERKLGAPLEGGFGQFRLMLEYKLRRQGKRLILVDRYFPSAKTCGACGHVEEGLPPEAKTWACPECGTRHIRAVNGAQNIKRQGLAQISA